MISKTIYFRRPAQADSPIPLRLPFSKSICSREIVISALSTKSQTFVNGFTESLSDDLAVLQHALSASLHQEATIDLQASGTALRFLTAYFALQTSVPILLTGISRLCNRPIAPLIDALRMLGARITCMEHEGFAPLYIEPAKLEGGKIIDLDASLSSQFVSALLLIAPCLPDGLCLQLSTPPASVSYIAMTIEVMKRAGVSVQVSPDYRSYTVAAGSYTPLPLPMIERDWSAAAFFYTLLAIHRSPSLQLQLEGIYQDSIQGDKKATEYFAALGVESRQRKNGIIIEYNSMSKNQETILRPDFSSCPDMLPAWVVAATLQERPFVATGIATLRHKESDRIAAVTEGLLRLGYKGLEIHSDSLVYHSTPVQQMRETIPTIDSYDDHRIAMAFAMASADRRFTNGLCIRGLEAVSKSFPNFESVAEHCGLLFTSNGNAY